MVQPLRIAERTGLDLGKRYAGILQRINDAVRIALARAVDDDSGGRILVQVSRDLTRLVAVRAQNVVAVAAEREAAERGPAAGRGERTARALRAGLPDHALRAGCAGSASRSSHAQHLGVAPRAGKSCCALR